MSADTLNRYVDWCAVCVEKSELGCEMRSPTYRTVGLSVGGVRATEQYPC
jgi:hypothetical protein